MCGIAGFIHLGVHREMLTLHLADMLAPLMHRGPDDDGVWVDQRHGVGLGHRRLSVLDLSPAGHQPMTSTCGRFVIVFNGEIYNHLDLRKQLEKSNELPIGGWRGHSDTETLLVCFSVWGIEKTLCATVGMFALGLWDKRERALILARDRIGEKPLYYGWQNEAFLFGSELKALRSHPAFKGKMDWRVASAFLHLNYIPAPSSIYEGIFKLVPGTFLQLKQENIRQGTVPSVIPYWSLGEAAKAGVENPFTGSFRDAVTELEFLMCQSVRLQSIADVPVGAFLSGGIDSSAIVAMMKSVTTSKVTTFCIGMPEADMDESRHAAAVARHLGTDHVEHIIQPREALDLIPRLPEIWDEPLADSSQIPTFLVSQLAKEHVTVVLSGDGGDEFFLGYPQYALYQQIWSTRHLGKIPWASAFTMLAALNRNDFIATGIRRAQAIVGAWQQPNQSALNRYWTDRYRQGNVPLADQYSAELLEFANLSEAAATAGLWDAGNSLPDSILVKVDRAAMTNSLETRAPLLDHRIIELSFRLPFQYKLRRGQGKRVLREVLYRHVPKPLVDRPKKGFSIPLSSWLKSELRPWVESLIDSVPNDSEHFNKATINRLWQDHLSGKASNTEKMWGILMLLSFQ